jgi:hypothetical protein
MKYALLIYVNEAGGEGLSEEEQAAVSGEYFAIRDVPGVYAGDHLQPVHAATTVRVQDGRTLTTDGPFADTKEFLGGYYLLEADDIDTAIEIAARVPAARMGGAIEVRPIVEHPS